MTVTITTDFTQHNPATSSTGWTSRGSMQMISTDSQSQAEGSGCLAARLQSGVGDFSNNHGSTDHTDKHLYCWIRPTVPFNTVANSGVTIRISSSTTGSASYGQWVVGGNDLGIRAIKGWFCATVDMLRPFSTINGTPPAITAIISSGVGANYLAGNGMEAPCVDEIKFGSLITIGGGTGGAPGVMQEVVDNDISNGRGLFKNAGGAFYVNVRLLIGNSASASSEFQDANQVLIFESDLFIAGHLLGMFFIGNATGTNNFRLGSSSGSGVDKEGSGGGFIKASGSRPFRIDADDANMDAIQFFGTAFLGQGAVLHDDPVRNFKVEDSGTGFTDDTRDANDPGTGDAPAMPSTQAVNDASYFGHDERFYEINIDLGTAKGGTWTGTWEYFDGTVWASLTDVTDGTSNYATTGPQVVTFACPDDWAKNTVDTDNRFWVRFRISSFTSSGTTPVIDECSVGMASDVRLGTSAVECIRCTFTEMGSIRVRGGAFLKKSVIDGSHATAKHAALDLGGADPAADTVRDLTVQNCARGILLKGTGNVTYNFRNIQFANNTNDVRVDFGSGDTVTINVLEGGDVPTIDNVNGSTVVINNSVTVEVHVEDDDGNDIANARVAIYTDPGGAELLNVDTDGSGNASFSHNFVGDQDIDIRVRESPNTASGRFFPFFARDTIKSSGFSLNVILQADNIATVN